MYSSATDERRDDPKNNFKLIDVLGCEHGNYCGSLSRQD